MKHALITFGNEESYGLSFVGGELLEHKQEIKFFDGDNNGFRQMIGWQPDFVMFGPLSTFYKRACSIAASTRCFVPKNTKIVFGGHHAFADPDIVKNDFIDTVVVGPVRGSIERILAGETGIIKTEPTCPADMAKPARTLHYADIPRIGKRYRKFALSMLGCRWNCSYCSSSSNHIREEFGNDAFRRYYYERRPLDEVMAELKEIATFDTKEIEWVDDDIFSGPFFSSWLEDFHKEYKKHINLPMYISTTSVGVLQAGGYILGKLRDFVNVVGMGVQAIRPESLKLFNRSWDNEGKMKAAYDRLVAFGYRVNLQFIVGLPVKDPVEDAIETLLAVKRIGPGSICSIYPLMVYPGTQMANYCKENNIELNEDCSGDTNSAVCNIKFDLDTQRKLRNICKLGTFFVKYDVSERWIRTLIDIDFDDKTSQKLSLNRYYECVTDRLGEQGKQIFGDILETMKLTY